MSGTYSGASGVGGVRAGWGGTSFVRIASRGLSHLPEVSAGGDVCFLQSFLFEC